MRWNAFLMLAAIAAMAALSQPAFAGNLTAEEQANLDKNAWFEAGLLQVVELDERVFSGCGLNSGTDPNMKTSGANLELITAPFTISVTGWTGGCKNGKRDGAGRYDTVSSMSPGGSSFTSSGTEEGTAVDGRRIGLWCNPKTRTQSPNYVRTCRLYGIDGIYAGQYRKLDDGRWYVTMLQSKDVVPDAAITLPAGTLEAESDRLIAAARAGGPSGPSRLMLSSSAFDNLTQGATMRPGTAPHRIDLRGKRVALVFTDATLAAIKRIPADLQTAMAASGMSADPSSYASQMMINNASIDMLLKSLGAPLLRAGAIVSPANDLTSLTNGSADYVMLVDWRYDWHANYTQRDFQRLKVCTQSDQLLCDYAFRENLSLFLIAPGPTIVRLQTQGKAATKGWEDADLSSSLSTIFFSDWGPTFGLANTLMSSILQE
jgi:hypothetical protein